MEEQDGAVDGLLEEFVRTRGGASASTSPLQPKAEGVVATSSAATPMASGPPLPLDPWQGAAKAVSPPPKPLPAKVAWSGYVPTTGAIAPSAENSSSSNNGQDAIQGQTAPNSNEPKAPAGSPFGRDPAATAAAAASVGGSAAVAPAAQVTPTSGLTPLQTAQQLTQMTQMQAQMTQIAQMEAQLNLMRMGIFGMPTGGIGATQPAAPPFMTNASVPAVPASAATRVRALQVHLASALVHICRNCQKLSFSL